VALGAAAGALVALGFVAPVLWFSALLAPLLLLRALDRGASARVSLLAGWAAGAVPSALACLFLARMLRHHGAAGWPLSLAFLAIFSLLQGLPWAAWGLGTWAGLRGGLPLPVAFALAHLASSLVPTPLPWSLAGVVTDRIELLQAAEIGGAPAASLLLLAAGVAAHELASRRWRSGPGWLGFFLLGALLGALRVRQIDQRAALGDRWTVGLVGSDTPVGRPAAAVEGLLALQKEQQELEAQAPQLTVWPESSIPFPVEESGIETQVEAQIGAWPGVPLLLGATVGSGGEEHNSALLLGPRDLQGRHDKQTLLPLAETLPRGMSWIRPHLPWASTQRPGGPDTGMSMDRAVLEVCLCSECLHADALRKRVTSEPSILVDLSNDGWFDGAIAPRLHAGQVRLRAIEHRRFLLRATNRGETGVVGPTGRWEAATSTPGRLLALVAPLAGQTLFAQTGDLGPWLALLLLIGARVRCCVTGAATRSATAA
jgi:apolipoprotein N-acyltransferase